MYLLKNFKAMAGLLVLVVALISAIIIFAARPESDPFQADAITDPPFPSLTYSIQAFLWWDGGEVGLHLDWVRLMSFSHVKQTFAWKDMEPNPGEWHFGQADNLLRQVEERELKVVARLGGTPDWAYEGDETDFIDAPPTNLDDWANFCFTVANQYKGRISAYQIWNEPNLTREWGNLPPDPAAYVELLRVCSEAIREADPDAILISAGLAPTGTHNEIATPDNIYLDHMYRNNFQQYIDVVGVHAPGYGMPPEYGPDDAERDGNQRWATFRRVEDMRKIMIQHGDASRQIALLEFGWTTDPVNPEYSWYRVDEDTQAQYLVDAYAYAAENWRPWVGLMSLIYMPKPVWTEADEEYWWAISTPDKGHRPAFYSLANMAKYCDDFVIPEREPDSAEALGLVPAPICP